MRTPADAQRAGGQAAAGLACRVFDYRWTKFPSADACMAEAHSVGSFVRRAPPLPSPSLSSLATHDCTHGGCEHFIASVKRHPRAILSTPGTSGFRLS